MQGEGVHVEFSFTGISRDMLHAVHEWMWELIQPAFPIITGAWGIEQTVYFSAAIAGVALLARLIRYLNEGESSPDRITAGVAGTTGGMAAHTPEPAKAATFSALTRTGPTATTITGGYSKAVPLILSSVHRSMGFISRMGLNYLLLSLLVCVFFGTGDLQLLEVLFGIGGRG